MSVVYSKNKAVIDNTNSPHVKLRNINFDDCEWTTGFLADKMAVCQEVMVPHMGTIFKGDVGHLFTTTCIHHRLTVQTKLLLCLFFGLEVRLLIFLL